MDSDKSIGLVGQGKSPVGQEQDRQGEHERECFKNQVRRVSCGSIADQTKKASTTASNARGYLFDHMHEFLRIPLYLIA